MVERALCMREVAGKCPHIGFQQVTSGPMSKIFLFRYRSKMAVFNIEKSNMLNPPTGRARALHARGSGIDARILQF